MSDNRVARRFAWNPIHIIIKSNARCSMKFIVNVKNFCIGLVKIVPYFGLCELFLEG